MRALLLGALLTGLVSAHASASSTTVSGNFVSDDAISTHTFAYDGKYTLVAFTTSFAAGGFEPLISLYSPTGAYIDGAGGNGEGDAYLAETGLAAGTYTFVLTQDINYPSSTLAAGFSQQNTGNYIVTELGGPAPFYDTVLGSQRTGAFSITIQTVPEPGPLGLAFVGLTLAGLTLRAARSRS